ncbi:MAG: SDR family NAD(P)-dependent oxidoreductase [Labilithrix sp.]|nr:SDR family NAD(P)-dependent oxidoreductase [Labilithrix sp.]
MSTSSSYTPEELQRCIDLLESFVDDRTHLTTMDRAARVRLLMAAGRISRPTRDESRRTAKAFRKKARKQVLAHDREATAATEIRTARRAEVYVAPPQLVGRGADGEPEELRELLQPRDCYICKQSFRRLHFFYDAMCPSCAELNYAKRFQTASLEGRTALITGARIKIGFQSALMMLRAGARVIVTTRFPRDAAARFAREADFAKWRDRLEVFGLDLRHSPSVEIFARFIAQTESRLDIIINNAAQTVRRPAAFYAHLLEAEQRAFAELPAAVQSVLRGHEACKSGMAIEAPHALGMPGATGPGGSTGFVAWRGGDGPGVGIRSSAMLSQIPCAYDDTTQDREVFPAGRSDADLQQVDLRKMNSWRLTLSDVPAPEMLEVQLVNAVAPFILCSKLKPLMMRDRTGEKHIVNVSAMEGQFARRTKTDKHPHTNMAKAALNMMTLTSAPDYAASGIFMNAVDTGWVTDEDPIAISQRKQEVHDFQPPLDIVDGAARVCDPFFSGLITGQHVWGKFLKDYAPTEW